MLWWSLPCENEERGCPAVVGAYGRAVVGAYGRAVVGAYGRAVVGAYGRAVFITCGRIRVSRVARYVFVCKIEIVICYLAHQVPQSPYDSVCEA